MVDQEMNIEGLPEPTEQQQYEIPQLALVTLTPQNKNCLLRNAIEASDDAMETSQALMARLEQYHPATARDFGFKNVAISKAPLRLLSNLSKRTKATSRLKKAFRMPVSEEGRPGLVSISSTAATSFKSFIAVSYCWHNQDWTPAPVCHRSEGWPLSSMMMSELLRQRQSRDEGLWIDACCIQQHNEIEKMHAIGSMDLIYKSARIVFFVLEDLYLSSSELDTLGMIKPRARDKAPPAVAQLCPRILSSRLFTRAWCWHEFQMAANPIFLVPTERGPWVLNINTIYKIYQSGNDSYPVPTSFPQVAFETLLRSARWRDIQWCRRTPMAQFNGLIYLNASRGIDMLAVAANVAGLQLYFTGSDTSIHSIDWVLAMLALSAGDLSVLCGTGPAVHMQLSAKEEGRSWLRWNMNLENFVASLSPPSFLQRSQINSVHPHRIILDLFVFQHYILHTPSTLSMLKATAFVDRHAKTFNRQTWMGTDPTTRFEHNRRRCQVEALACSLDCGLTWLMNNLMFNQDVANRMQWMIELVDFDIWPLVANLLIDVYPLEEHRISSFTSEQKRTITQSIWFTLFETTTGHLPSFYESGIFKSSDLRCLRLDWGTLHGKALTFIGTGETQLPECHLAVPTALGIPSCATMDRLWLLKPSDGKTGNEWTIIEKIKLVTLQPLKDDAGNLVRRAEQIIRA